MYLGSNVQYRVRGAGDHIWSVTEMNPHVIRENGSSMTLTAHQSDVIILKA